MTKALREKDLESAQEKEKDFRFINLWYPLTQYSFTQSKFLGPLTKYSFTQSKVLGPLTQYSLTQSKVLGPLTQYSLTQSKVLGPKRFARVIAHTPSYGQSKGNGLGSDQSILKKAGYIISSFCLAVVICFLLTQYSLTQSKVLGPKRFARVIAHTPSYGQSKGNGLRSVLSILKKAGYIISSFCLAVGICFLPKNRPGPAFATINYSTESTVAVNHVGRQEELSVAAAEDTATTTSLDLSSEITPLMAEIFDYLAKHPESTLSTPLSTGLDLNQDGQLDSVKLSAELAKHQARSPDNPLISTGFYSYQNALLGHNQLAAPPNQTANQTAFAEYIARITGLDFVQLDLDQLGFDPFDLDQFDFNQFDLDPLDLDQFDFDPFDLYQLDLDLLDFDQLDFDLLDFDQLDFDLLDFDLADQQNTAQLAATSVLIANPENPVAVAAYLAAFSDAPVAAATNLVSFQEVSCPIEEIRNLRTTKISRPLTEPVTYDEIKSKSGSKTQAKRNVTVKETNKLQKREKGPELELKDLYFPLDDSVEYTRSSLHPGENSSVIERLNSSLAGMETYIKNLGPLTTHNLTKLKILLNERFDMINATFFDPESNNNQLLHCRFLFVTNNVNPTPIGDPTIANEFVSIQYSLLNKNLQVVHELIKDTRLSSVMNTCLENYKKFLEWELEQYFVQDQYGFQINQNFFFHYFKKTYENSLNLDKEINKYIKFQAQALKNAAEKGWNLDFTRSGGNRKTFLKPSNLLLISKIYELPKRQYSFDALPTYWLNTNSKQSQGELLEKKSLLYKFKKEMYRPLNLYRNALFSAGRAEYVSNNDTKALKPFESLESLQEQSLSYDWPSPPSFLDKKLCHHVYRQHALITQGNIIADWCDCAKEIKKKKDSQLYNALIPFKNAIVVRDQQNK